MTKQEILDRVQNVLYQGADTESMDLDLLRHDLENDIIDGDKVGVETYYELNVPAGTYSSDNIFSLLWEVFTHRLSHLRKHGKWID